MAPSELLKAQWRFSHMAALLQLYAERLGYQVTQAGTYREGDKRCHGKRLATDINLFTPGGVWLKDDVTAYTSLGVYWESLGGAWGGRFEDSKRPGGPDLNHFSIAYGGYK